MKRAFRAFGPIRVFKFRELLQKNFVWRLNIDNPLVIELFLDTMVMDNDDGTPRRRVADLQRRQRISAAAADL